MKTKKLILIDGLCYLYPHREEIVCTHPSMMGVWKTCEKLLRENKGSMMVPLLVDDIQRDFEFREQSVDEIIEAALKKSYSDLPWFGDSVLESSIEKQYGNLGCKFFDSIFHRDILLSINGVSNDWVWIAVLPDTFKEQQSGMLSRLWKLIFEHVNFSALALSNLKKTEDVRENVRKEFLSHFIHYWISDKGAVSSITHPVYKGGKFVHEL